VVKVVRRYGRFHHDVDYRGFKENQLKWCEPQVARFGTNEFGMKLITVKQQLGETSNDN
jgi:hypothetical protein